MAFSKARRLGELVTTAGVLDQATVATASSGDNDTSPASTAFVTGAIADLSDSAPGTLNTLNELAAALGDDANFSTTVTNSIATKLPLAGGTLTGNLAHASDFTLDVGGDITLDAGGENIRFDLNGNEVGQIDLGSANMTFRTSQGGDIIFRGTPSGGSELAMLTLDTSESGDATFSNDIYLTNGKFLRWGDGSVRIYGDSTDGTELMTFVTGGTERMRISDNGFLKLSSKVSFSGTGDAGLGHHTNNYMYMYGGTAGLILQDNSAGSNRMLIRDSGTVEFEVNGAERARITSSGVLALGKTSDDSTSEGVWIRKHPSSGHGQIMCTGTSSSAYEGLYVYDITNSELEFYASYHGTIAYRATYNMSDERKKDNIQDITLGLDAVKELRPVSFDWKNDKGKDVLGFIAQEVETTSLKQLVGNYKDDNIDDLRSLNKEGLIPVLVKAVQELSAKLDAAEARIETLEG